MDRYYPCIRNRVALALVLMTAAFPAFAGNPIPNFREVEEGMFRGGSPTPEGVAYLKSIGVKTIVTFEARKKVLKAEREAAEAAGIRWIALPITAFDLPKDEEIDSTLEVMRDPAARPIFVHCRAGRDRTGLFIGLHRVLNSRWQPGHAWQEMLELGYRKIFFPLTKIFERRTGFDTP